MKLKVNKKKIIRIVIIILLLICFIKNYYNITSHIPFFPIFWFEKQENWSLKFVRYERFWEGLNFLYFLDPDFIWRKDENWQLTWKCREFAWGKISNIWYYKDWKKEWKWIWYYKNWKISNVWYYKNWLENWEFIYYYVNWKNISTIIKYDNWKVLEEIHYYTWGQIKSIINMENWLESIYYNEDWTVKDSFWGNKIFFQIENWENKTEYSNVDKNFCENINNTIWNRCKKTEWLDYSGNNIVTTIKWIWWEKISDKDLQVWLDLLMENWDWFYWNLDISKIEKFTDKQLEKLSLIEKNHKVIYNENLKS